MHAKHAPYTERYKKLETHELIFNLILAIHLTPLLLTRLYKFLENKYVFITYFILSAFLFSIPFFITPIDHDQKTINHYSTLATPFIFIILYKLFDVLSLFVSKRHIIMSNWYLMKPNESPNIIDYIAFLVLVIVPTLVPLAIAKNFL